VIECLRTNQAKLSTDCKDKLLIKEKVALVDEDTDYTLQTKCKSAIEEFCHVDSSVNVIDCLRKNLLKHSLGLPCRQTVINRIMVQNKDVRLNPSLWRSCSKDVAKLCRNHFVDLTNVNEILNGKVIKCLKSNLVNNKLSKLCEIEVSEVMREAANVDYRLDPMLADSCLTELETLCSDEPNDKKENCLRLKFQHMKISKESSCYDVCMI
jgi:hypothetical protein